MIKLGIDAPPESRTAQVIQILETDIEIQTLWYMANRTSRRAAVNDHGPVHVRTAMHHGDSLLQLLIEAGIQPNCVTDHALTEDDARVVVLLGLAMHDVGMSIHRDRHELLSVPIALDWLRRRLPPIYVEPQLTVVISEVVHAVLAHNVHERCLTLEAGIVKVADALDMTKGRSRKAISAGKIDIHSISAAAVERVRVTRGTNKPIRVEVDINNPSAVFHLKEVFGQKLAHSTLEPYVEVPKLDELLESLRELGTSEDPQRDAEAAATTAGAPRPDPRGLGEPIGIGRGRVPTTIA
ncbi:MAG TPA: HD domain-containing protein [Chloroflexota bacterium]|nr:HD domain-containing protein [Chloroflexota bacterium]